MRRRLAATAAVGCHVAFGLDGDFEGSSRLWEGLGCVLFPFSSFGFFGFQHGGIIRKPEGRDVMWNTAGAFNTTRTILIW